MSNAVIMGLVFFICWWRERCHGMAYHVDAALVFSDFATAPTIRPRYRHWDGYLEKRELRAARTSR